jgi:hypothetical protein
VSHSYNEIEALVKRAARGVSLSWGMADESAKATRWLAERGLPGPQTMLQLLELHDTDTPVKPVVEQGNWYPDSEGLLCPVVTGTALSDFSMLLAQYKSIRCTGVACPLLLLPFVAHASLTLEACLSIRWNSEYFVIEGNRVASNSDPAQMDEGVRTFDAESAAVVVEVGVTTFDEQLKSQPSLRECKCVPRASVDQQCRERLSVYAHRTYAPASEESRRLGAGAGDSDNE